MADINRRKFIEVSAATAAAAAFPGAGCTPQSGTTVSAGAKHVARKIDYAKAKATPTVCFGCTTQCHVVGWVQDEKVVGISGNPLDPNTAGHICAKANGIINSTYYPNRILYPMKRVGRRGEGKWRRISWEEALDEISARLKKLMDKERPDKFAIQVGRDKTLGLTQRFLRTVGSPHGLNRRSICSTNNRLGNMTYYGTVFDWGTPDFARTQYILNFGSNIMEAHQGGFGGMKRIQDARVDHGAKLVTFEIRPSATASVSDEYFAVKPGTDGAIAMAMAHVIVEKGLADQKFWNRWCNMPWQDIVEHLKPFTPEFAEQESGVPAADIKRIAIAFAEAAPRCTTLINRGIAKHYNGVHGSRAVRLLDILVGNVGKPGGFSIMNRGQWKGGWGQWGLPRVEEPGPKPPKPSKWKPGMPQFDELPDHVKERYDRMPASWQAAYQGELMTPSEYPLAWQWQVMRVGQVNYPYIKEGRAQIDTLFTYVFNGAYAYPEAKLCREVLQDETLLPFHVSIDIAYSETAALADIILPDATALERWNAQSTNAWDLIPITGVRQPLVKPAGEARSVFWIYQQLAKRLGDDAYRYWDWESEEHFYKAWYKNLPISWEEFKRVGVWHDETRERDYELFERPVAKEELEGSEVDEKTDQIRKDGKVVGIMIDGKAVRGFPSPSGKIEVRQENFNIAAGVCGLDDDPIANPLPTYFRVPGHEKMRENELRFVTFKWNVHTQGRTAHHKYQAEIVHGNPVWIHPDTAKQLQLKDGDWIDVTIRRPAGAVYLGDENADTGTFRQYVRLVPGVSPGTIAVSHHLGHWEFAPVGNGVLSEKTPGREGMNQELMADRDIPDNIWWAKSKNGVGTGVYINDAMPLAPTPLTGGQMWMDGVCRVRKVEV